jgi:hypothetical protein
MFTQNRAKVFRTNILHDRVHKICWVVKIVEPVIDRAIAAIRRKTQIIPRDLFWYTGTIVLQHIYRPAAACTYFILAANSHFRSPRTWNINMPVIAKWCKHAQTYGYCSNPLRSDIVVACKVENSTT